MGVSNIGWTDYTWNPWRGCTKVSPGCDNCYMFRNQGRYGRDPSVMVRAADKTFNAPLHLDEPSMIFTCSWSDFFHVDADEWRDEAWRIIKYTPQQTYQILTKRPALVERRLPADWGNGYKNVWLGVSVEDQDRAVRIRTLRDTPARVRFVSFEPLIGPVETSMEDIDWAIIGGESGPDRRQMEVAWADRLAQDCIRAKVPVFVKQDSMFRPGQQGSLPDWMWELKQFPKFTRR